MSSEPGGSYAFHDERRIARARPEAAKLAEAAALTDAIVQNDGWAERPFAPSDGLPPHEGMEAVELLDDDALLFGAREHVTTPPPEAERPEAPAPAPEATDGLPTTAAAAAPAGIWQALPSVVGSTPERGEDSASAFAANAPRGEHEPLVGQAEQLIERGAWEELVQLLSPQSRLPPALELLLLIGRREVQDGRDREQANALSRAIIATVARVLSLPEESPAALVIAKRLMRRNPGWSRKQPANRLSVGIVMIGLSLGAAIGWLLTKLTL